MNDRPVPDRRKLTSNPGHRSERKLQHDVLTVTGSVRTAQQRHRIYSSLETQPVAREESTNVEGNTLGAGGVGG